MADSTAATTAEAPPPAPASAPPPPPPEPEKPPMGDEKPPENLKAKVAVLLTIITFIVSLPLLGCVVWILYMRDYDCEPILRLPRLQIGIGISLIFMFIISNAVLFIRKRFPMPGMIVVIVPLLIMLTVGLALVGAYDMESRNIIGSPKWFRLKIGNKQNWNNIKSCIYDTQSCQDLDSSLSTLRSYDISTRKFTSIESGCCKPPAICGMEYVNATYWKRSEVVDGSIENEDCERWSNDQTTLCYNCESCKEGFLKTLGSKWWKLGVFMVCMALLLIVFQLLVFLASMWERF